VPPETREMTCTPHAMMHCSALITIQAIDTSLLGWGSVLSYAVITPPRYISGDHIPERSLTSRSCGLPSPTLIGCSI